MEAGGQPPVPILQRPQAVQGGRRRSKAVCRRSSRRRTRRAAYHAEDDRRREEVEIRNDADSRVYATKKLLRGTGHRDTPERAAVERALTELRKTMESGAPDAVRRATDELNRALHAYSALLYRQPTPAGEGPSQDGADGEGDVVDAEIVDEPPQSAWWYDVGGTSGTPARARHRNCSHGRSTAFSVRGMHGQVMVVDDVAGAFCDAVVDAFGRRVGDSFAMALSGGETARRCYERLAHDGATRIDWWQVDVYWGDERCVPPDHPDSNELLGRHALLEQVGAANAVHPMRCDDGANAYQLVIGELDHFDVVHLGLGADGHTASLFPDSPALDAEEGLLVVMNEDPTGRNPHRRMTLTYAGIAKARLAVFTVAGEAKRPAMEALLAGGNGLPAARVQAEEVVWLVDPAAAPPNLRR